MEEEMEVRMFGTGSIRASWYFLGREANQAGDGIDDGWMSQVFDNGGFL